MQCVYIFSYILTYDQKRNPVCVRAAAEAPEADDAFLHPRPRLLQQTRHAALPAPLPVRQ